jgi:hypothetical protein
MKIIWMKKKQIFFQHSCNRFRNQRNILMLNCVFFISYDAGQATLFTKPFSENEEKRLNEPYFTYKTGDKSYNNAASHLIILPIR